MPSLLGSDSCLAIQPWRSTTTTTSTARAASRTRCTRDTQWRSRWACPALRSAVIRRTTPTRTADPGMDRMKNRPRSWAMAP